MKIVVAKSNQGANVLTEQICKNHDTVKISRITEQNQSLIYQQLMELQYDVFFPSFPDFFIEKYIALNKHKNTVGLQDEGIAAYIADKEKYYQCFENLKIPHPKIYQYLSLQNYTKVNLDEICFPVIVKPINSSGGCNIKIVEDKKQLLSYIFTLFSPRTFDDQVALQEYIVGDVCSVAGRVVNNVVKIDLLCDISTDCYPHVAETSFAYPSKHEKTKQKIIQYLECFFRSINFNNHPFMLDYIVRDDEIFFIDFGARVTTTPQIIISECGVDNYSEVVVDCLHGRDSVVTLSGRCQLQNVNKFKPTTDADVKLEIVRD